MNEILVVENDRDIFKVNSGNLQQRGYKVQTAATLAEARARLAARYPDLILLDDSLPDGSGLAFCAELREQSDVPVLFLSCRREKRQIVECLQSGGDGYMTRPFDEEELTARVFALLRRTEVNGCGVRAAYQKGHEHQSGSD